MDHGKKKMMHGGKHMYGGKMKVKKMMKGGKMMPKRLSEGIKPMFMAGGKVFKDGGKLMEALLKNPEQRSRAKRILGMK